MKLSAIAECGSCPPPTEDLIKDSPCISFSHESDIEIIKKSKVTCTSLQLIRTTVDFIVVIISCHNKKAVTSFIILLHTQLWLKPRPSYLTPAYCQGLFPDAHRKFSQTIF